MLYQELIERLKKNINYEPTQKEIAEILNLTQAAIAKKISRESEFKKNELDLIEGHYAISITGELPNRDFITLTYLPDVYLSAGYGVEALEERAETMLIDACLLVSERGVKYNPDKCEVVRISGNSMSPEYRHGDRVIINKDDTELIDGHIFAFRYKNQCYVKEINLMGDRVKCISLNKEYDPFYIESNEDFKVFGRILPRIRL